MEFKILNENQKKEWNSFNDSSPQGSIFTRTEYLDALNVKYKLGFLCKGKEIQCGIPLIKNEINLYANPMLMKNLGILVRKVNGSNSNIISTQMKIIQEAIKYIKQYKSFDYKFHPSFKNWLPFFWNGYKQETHYTYQIKDLSDLDFIQKNYMTRVRTSIRKAEKNDIVILPDITPGELFDVCKMTFSRQNAKVPYSYEVIKNLYDHLKAKNMVKFMGAMGTDSKLHAVCGLVYDKRSCNLILNGINPFVSDCGANTKLISESIKFASTVSDIYDFEGSMMKPIERFYRSFGGELTPYYRIWQNSSINLSKNIAIKLYKKVFNYER